VRRLRSEWEEERLTLLTVMQKECSTVFDTRMQKAPRAANPRSPSYLSDITTPPRQSAQQSQQQPSPRSPPSLSEPTEQSAAAERGGNSEFFPDSNTTPGSRRRQRDNGTNRKRTRNAGVDEFDGNLGGGINNSTDDDLRLTIDTIEIHDVFSPSAPSPRRKSVGNESAVISPTVSDLNSLEAFVESLL